MNPRNIKHKGVVEISYEALSKLLMIAPNINVNNVSVNDSNETLRIKLSASQEERYNETNRMIVKETGEGEEIDTTLKLSKDEIVFILTEQLKSLSSSSNNKEFLNIILALTDSRPNLSKYIAQEIVKPVSERMGRM